jgi:hypothetical protein
VRLPFGPLGLLPPEPLRDGSGAIVVHPDGDEYVPLAHVLLRDLRSLGAALDIQLDPLPEFGPGQFFLFIPPIEVTLQVGPVFDGTNGALHIDVFDFGFLACLDLEPENDDNDPICIDTDPSYVRNTPWHVWPLFIGGPKFDPFA